MCVADSDMDITGRYCLAADASGGLLLFGRYYGICGGGGANSLFSVRTRDDDTSPDAAVIVASPMKSLAVYVSSAIPSVVTADESMVPVVAENCTLVPFLTAFPAESLTAAVIVTVSALFAVSCAAEDERAIVSAMLVYLRNERLSSTEIIFQSGRPSF